MQQGLKIKRSKISVIYEITIWVLYVGMYKYAYYVEFVKVKNTSLWFPHPQVIFYAVTLSLYWLLYYRMIVPRILERKKFWLLLPVILVFVLLLSLPNNYIVSWIFKHFDDGKGLKNFYAYEYWKYSFRMHNLKGWSLDILFPDLIAFSSIAFLRYALESEYKRWQTERQNYQLKIDSLRAQINPHFLFNTLNSVYGMTLLGKKDAPEFILRMSNAMRYILYESNAERVLLEKEVEFVESFLAIEHQRLDNTFVQFSSQGIDTNTMIAPLILLPFIENSIKHGAHHFKKGARITCNIVLKQKNLFFEIFNEVHKNDKHENRPRGVGIENVKTRLKLYYPDKHTLLIQEKDGFYKVYLSIDLNNS